MRVFTKVFLAFLMIGLCAACSTTGTSSSQDNSGQSTEARYQEPDYYLDFDDIMIPKEISYVNDESYKLDNAKFRASIMRFKGRVEVLELVQYFINNMTKDNWTLSSDSKASSVRQMIFEKFNKSCIIQVEDSFATTKTTIFAVEVKDTAGTKSK